MGFNSAFKGLKELLMVLLFASFRIQVNFFRREDFDDTNTVRTTKKIIKLLVNLIQSNNIISF